MKTTIKIVTGLVAVIILALLMALPLMWLWNGLMPEIFGLTTIGFEQALGLSVLSSILFKPN